MHPQPTFESVVLNKYGEWYANNTESITVGALVVAWILTATTPPTTYQVVGTFALAAIVWLGGLVSRMMSRSLGQALQANHSLETQMKELMARYQAALAENEKLKGEGVDFQA